MNDLSDHTTTTTTVVVGASRGLGRGTAAAFAAAGAHVVAVARSATTLFQLAASVVGVEPVVADAGDPTLPGALIDRYQPDTVVVAAGASPLMRPLHHQTWETFAATWNTDVRIAFHWLREALLTPLRPGSRVIVISSGAALKGSPLSGGYAGAKATQRFITGYAQDEAHRAGLDISFTTVLPQLTPATDLGATAVRAYAARAGQPTEDYLRPWGDPLTPQTAGNAVVQLAQTPNGDLSPSYLLTSGGLHPLPDPAVPVPAAGG